MNIDESIERERKTAAAGFAKWQAEPAVRLGMSLLPPSEHADALKLLLQSAYEAGFVAGTSAGMAIVMREMMKPRKEADGTS